MKFLIGLSVLQTAVLIIVVALLARSLADSSERERAQEPSHMSFLEPSAANEPSHSINHEQLRAVIREEFASLKNGQLRDSPQALHSANDEPTKPALSATAAAKLAEQREFVSRTIESFKHAGEVPADQMQELVSSIGRLDEQGRIESLSLLARAINTGAIKGRL
jgi:hypothetical protein